MAIAADEILENGPTILGFRRLRGHQVPLGRAFTARGGGRIPPKYTPWPARAQVRSTASGRAIGPFDRDASGVAVYLHARAARASGRRRSSPPSTVPASASPSRVAQVRRRGEERASARHTGVIRSTPTPCATLFESVGFGDDSGRHREGLEHLAEHETGKSLPRSADIDLCTHLIGYGSGSGFWVPGWVPRSSFVPDSPGVSTVPGSLVPSSRFVAGRIRATAILRTRHLEPEPVNRELGTNPEPGSQPGTQNPEPGTVLNTNEFRV